MKIAFLCGSIEPARDGVGDYTRRLAGELIRQGHEITVFALNDYNTLSTLKGIQSDGGVQVPFERMPAVISWEERVSQVKKSITDLNPDWISLQFVPFSYHHKGLLSGLHKYFEELGRGRKWHIMFHELWVGMEENPPLKFRLLGWMQRKQIKKLLIKLKPDFIHTHTKIYGIQLKKLGFEAAYLPLFTNIAVGSGNYKNNELHDTKELSFVLFGHIHNKAPVEQFAKELMDYSKQSSSKITLKILGRSGDEQVRWQTAFTSLGLNVEVFGEQPSSEISRILSGSRFGITTTPIALAEKSGVVAAMWAHHLSVVSVCLPWNPRGITNTNVYPGIIEYKQGKFATQFSTELSAGPVNEVSSIAFEFVQSLRTIK